MSGHRFTAADCRRIIRALPAAVAFTDGPEHLLADLGSIRDALHVAEHTAVRMALADGMSLSGIAEHLGISRQAAHQRWAELAKVKAPQE